MNAIDPIRRAAEMRAAAAARRARLGRVEKADGAARPDERLLPVPYRAPSLPVGGDDLGEAATAFSAQLIGQERRRPRPLVDILDTARSVYVRTEWSGPADRRARKGSVSRTVI